MFHRCRLLLDFTLNLPHSSENRRRWITTPELTKPNPLQWIRYDAVFLSCPLSTPSFLSIRTKQSMKFHRKHDIMVSFQNDYVFFQLHSLQLIVVKQIWRLFCAFGQSPKLRGPWKFVIQQFTRRLGFSTGSPLGHISIAHELAWRIVDIHFSWTMKVEYRREDGLVSPSHVVWVCTLKFVCRECVAKFSLTVLLSPPYLVSTFNLRIFSFRWGPLRSACSSGVASES